MALNTRFVMDEFWQVGQSKYLANGLFSTIWPVKAVGYVVFYKIAHIVGSDCVSIVLAARLQVALLSFGTIFLIYKVARAMGESQTRALVIVLVLLAFSTFIERIFRTRAEPVALFFAVGALLLLLRHPSAGWRSLWIAGVLSGLSFLSTQKAVYFNVALGASLLTEAVASRQLASGFRRAVMLFGGWASAVACYSFIFGGSDFFAVAANVFLAPIDLAANAHKFYGDFDHFLVSMFRKNFLLYFLSAMGLLIALTKSARANSARRLALSFSFVIIGFVFAHNQPWPYVFVMVLPFLSLWVLVPFDAFDQKQIIQRLLVATLVIGVSYSYLRNLEYLRHDNRIQLSLLAEADRLLPDGGTYFDGIGMLPHHLEEPRIWLDARGVYSTLRDGKSSPLYQSLMQSPPDMVIRSYRTTNLDSLLHSVFENRYQPVSPNILVPGRSLPNAEEVVFDTPVAGSYALYGSSGAPLDRRLRIDGVWVYAPFKLNVGRHVVLAEPGDDLLYLLPSGLALGPLSKDPHPLSLFDGVYSF